MISHWQVILTALSVQRMIQTINKLGIPDCFFQICDKLLACPDLPEAERRDISRWCSYIASDFVRKEGIFSRLFHLLKKHNFQTVPILKSIFCCLLYIYLTISTIRQKGIINEFKNKSLNGIDYFRSYY